MIIMTDADRYGVSAEAGWFLLVHLWLSEVTSLIYNFCVSAAARKIVRADRSLR